MGCTVVAVHVAGDHTIIVGKVEDVEIRGGESLLSFRGEYRHVRSRDLSGICIATQVGAIVRPGNGANFGAIGGKIWLCYVSFSVTRRVP